jgi:hypothetical protein
VGGLHENAWGDVWQLAAGERGRRLADQHAIAVAVEAVFGCYCVAIGAEDVFFSGERGDQGEEAGLREVEIR